MLPRPHLKRWPQLPHPKSIHDVILHAQEEARTRGKESKQTRLPAWPRAINTRVQSTGISRQCTCTLAELAYQPLAGSTVLSSHACPRSPPKTPSSSTFFFDGRHFYCSLVSHDRSRGPGSGAVPATRRARRPPCAHVCCYSSCTCIPV